MLTQPVKKIVRIYCDWLILWYTLCRIKQSESFDYRFTALQNWRLPLALHGYKFSIHLKLYLTGLL